MTLFSHCSSLLPEEKFHETSYLYNYLIFANQAIDGWNLEQPAIGASSNKAFTKKLRAVLLE